MSNNYGDLIMRMIIGILPNQFDIISKVNGLVEFGLPSENIQILTKENSIQKALGCDPICTVKYYAVGGAVLIGVIYSIFGLVAAWCECNLLSFDQPYGYLTLIGSVLAGGLVGGILGAMLGLGESEKHSHLYVQEARLGATVVLVNTMGDNAEQTKEFMRRGGFIGIKTLQ